MILTGTPGAPEEGIAAIGGEADETETEALGGKRAEGGGGRARRKGTEDAGADKEARKGAKQDTTADRNQEMAVEDEEEKGKKHQK